MNKLTWTRMNTEALISLPHDISILLLVFFLPSFVFYSLCTRSMNTLSLLSVRLFLSFSWISVRNLPPIHPLAIYILYTTTLHHHHLLLLSASTLHSNNNSNVQHIPVISAWETQNNWAKPGMEVVMANSEFNSVNITDIFDFWENNVFAHYGVIYLPLVRC